MTTSRRQFLAAGGGTAAALALAPRAFAQWQPSQRYPDPAVKILDPSFAKYRLGLAKVERLAHRLALVRGPGLVRRRPLPAVERHPEQPHHALGRGDRRGQRLPQAVEQRQRQHARPPGPARHLRARHAARHAHRVRRHDHGRSPTASRASRSTRPNDVVCKSDGSIWFTDPPFGILGYYEGHRRRPSCRPTSTASTRRPASLAVVAGDVKRPNGLAFSPDESKLYVVEAARAARSIYAFDVVDGGTRLANKRRLVDAGAGTPDGLRVDVDGNLWCGWGMGEEGLDGVAVFNPRRQAHRPHRPARALRQPLLRRPLPQPPVHVRLDVALFAVREHARLLASGGCGGCQRGRGGRSAPRRPVLAYPLPGQSRLEPARNDSTARRNGSGSLDGFTGG